MQTAEDMENQIVLYNDDVNTFDHVITTLIYACEHTSEQAEQCAIIVHYKGKCTVAFVKHGVVIVAYYPHCPYLR